VLIVYLATYGDMVGFV